MTGQANQETFPYTILHPCGHEVSYTFTGTREEYVRRAALQNTRPCPDCAARTPLGAETAMDSAGGNKTEPS